jgi:hypothetical protein
LKDVDGGWDGVGGDLGDVLFVSFLALVTRFLNDHFDDERVDAGVCVEVSPS